LLKPRNSEGCTLKQITLYNLMSSNLLFKKLYNDLLDFVYPPYCILCEAELEAENKLVCRDCWERLGSSSTRETFISKQRILALYSYSNDVRTIIHNLKYRSKTHLAVNLGRSIGKIIKGDKRIRKWDLLIPIPLHKVKQRSRGFNQSELIVDAIAEVSSIEKDSTILIRHRYTRNQAALPMRERAKNVKGAFTVLNKFKIEGKKIILVDDVVTTGSTMLECIKVLKEGGAKEVAGVSASLAV